MLNLLGVLAAMVTSVPAGLGEEPVPIRLAAEPAGDGVRLTVLGASTAEYRATFAVEVQSEGNRSLHRGSARLGGGHPVVLSTITMGNARPGHWSARLTVEPQDGDAYEQVRTSFDEGSD
jgi:hypothetical protein